MQIYKTTNLVNGKVYVGQEKWNNPNYLGSGKILRLAIKKYGIENFKKEILQMCFSQEEMDKAELFHQEKNNSFSPKGYNIIMGAWGNGDTWTYYPKKKERREKYKQKRKLWTYKFKTKEYKEKMSKLTSGEKNGMFGKHHTKKSKKKQSNTIAIKGSYSGKNNPRAKNWLLISPSGEKNYLRGNLEDFCKNNNLMMCKLKYFLNNTVDVSKNKIFHKRFMKKLLNTVGWSLHAV